MNPLEIKRFLTAVRPSGRGFLFTLDGKQDKQIVFDSNESAEALIAQAIAKKRDVFVSMAQFKNNSQSRTQDNAEYFASVWIDIDIECGDGKAKPYKTREGAV